MSELYRLVFAGEVNEGQHLAVVKKRLAALLKLDEERAQALFSGKPTVVKKAADKATAARYKAAFEKAGARLRIGKVASEEQTSTPTPAATSGDALSILPTGSDLLSQSERAEPVEADVDTSHISVQGSVFVAQEPQPEIAGPNVDHLSVADVGTQLADESLPLPEVEFDLDFDIADVGTTLGEEGEEPLPVIDLDDVDFDLAEAGADLDDRPQAAPPPAPDTSHLSVDPTD